MHLVFKSSLIFFVSLGSLFLVACGQSEPASDNASTAPETATEIDDNHDHSHHDHSDENAQVIISGLYHLELIAEPQDNGIDLNFHLENEESHKTIPNAKVKAEVKLPNGDEKMLDLQYKAESEQYVAFLSEQAKGQYEVTILTNINGEQVNGSFSFDR